jgi:ubiquinone biosynthesis monooxygenase Coq7
MIPDAAILAIDGLLKATLGTVHARRARPGLDMPETNLDQATRRHVGGLMRVNHAGEICAQALYQGQALTTPDPALKAAFRDAAQDEADHLAWTRQRLDELVARPSLLAPLWYAGSLLLGGAAGLAGNGWSLGFLAETERQVEAHLSDHLARLPAQDGRSRAILRQMRDDEAWHAHEANIRGATELPFPLRFAMKVGGRLMTRGAYYL